MAGGTALLCNHPRELADTMAKDDFTTYLVPGFHSDVVWLEDQRDYAVSLMGDVDQNLQVCRFDPAYGVFLHEITYLKPYLDVHPEQRDFVKQLIADGRIGTGGTHGQPIEACIGGEGLLRNILYGRLYHERCLGDEPEIAMLWDVFGHVPQLGQILAKTRFTGCIWSKDIRGAHAVFWHQALDGSRFLFRRVMYGFGPASETATLDYFRRAFEELRSYGFKSDLRLDCIDFKPPTAWMAGRCAALAKGKPAVVVSGTAHEAWFRAAHQRLADGKVTIPVTARDYEWHHQGTGLSRVNLKMGNRLAENAILNAERFGSIAAWLGADYPDKALDKAWRQVLFNQHHDGMAGPLCDRAYLDAMLGYREALELASDALRNSLGAIAGAVDTNVGPRNSIPLLVFNGLNWPRTEPVEATLRFEKPVESFELLGPDGKPAPFEVERVERNDDGKIAEAEIVFIAADVPPMGHTAFAVVPSKEPLPRREIEGGLTIENEFFRVTADPAQGGGITSLFDKRSRRELINADAGPGNELVALEENPNRSEPAWELYTMGPKVFSRRHAANVTVQVGPVSHRIVVHGEMTEGRPDTAFKRRHDIVLYPGVQRVFFRTRLDHYRASTTSIWPPSRRSCGAASPCSRRPSAPRASGRRRANSTSARRSGATTPTAALDAVATGSSWAAPRSSRPARRASPSAWSTSSCPTTRRSSPRPIGSRTRSSARACRSPHNSTTATWSAARSCPMRIRACRRPTTSTWTSSTGCRSASASTWAARTSTRRVCSSGSTRGGVRTSSSGSSATSTPSCCSTTTGCPAAGRRCPSSSSRRPARPSSRRRSTAPSATSTPLRSSRSTPRPT